MTSHTRHLYLEASRIASKYKWPSESKALSNYQCPYGFAREVGSAIALFMADPIPLLVRSPKLDDQAHTWEDIEAGYKQSGKELGKLRVILATLNTHEKVAR